MPSTSKFHGLNSAKFEVTIVGPATEQKAETFELDLYRREGGDIIDHYSVGASRSVPVSAEEYARIKAGLIAWEQLQAELERMFMDAPRPD